jgi:hypothetical protein
MLKYTPPSGYSMNASTPLGELGARPWYYLRLSLVLCGISHREMTSEISARILTASELFIILTTNEYSSQSLDNSKRVLGAGRSRSYLVFYTA